MVFHLEFPEDHLSSLLNLINVRCVANLSWVLVNKSLAILFELLIGFAFSFAASRTSVVCNERLEAELNSDAHKIGVLCYALICIDSLEKFELFILRQHHASRLLHPHNLGFGLLIHLAECATSDQELVLNGIFEIGDLSVLHGHLS